MNVTLKNLSSNEHTGKFLAIIDSSQLIILYIIWKIKKGKNCLLKN